MTNTQNSLYTLRYFSHGFLSEMLCMFFHHFSTQLHARESQFFSKVSATTATSPTTTVNNKGGVLNKNNEQDPSFIPETQNAYGLYGQESTQYHTTTKLSSADPYTTTPTSTIPYKTQETYTNNNNNENYYYSNNGYNNVNAYEDQQQNMQMGDTRLQDTGYTTTPASTSSNLNNNNNYYNNYLNGVKGYNNVEKQGMSDTRFLENGKYYYDPNIPHKGNNKFYTNQYQNTKVNYDNTRGGYYSNKNENNYEYNNMERSQNMDDFQNEQYDP